ncbi:hypothetical protein ABID82_005250 [Methylobacterium sp. PvP062]|uniref:Uncharacterized protein n=1 Tax=Methylobacterium radiotolerans TaxID=31998 RepID=A0ABV2NQ52_9HYPH|nr:MULTISPECIES: hypothetical protein [unclassified Methylobacterium]MBP2494625.1 hypothetical protein [Methylobacterium sp. PvP105]MBP2505504.1 hypothetical protein [Methylobacterium sp. PvP109]MCX7330098.1 hypothetical protein [Hyphomicrobiales bacterium]
MTERLATQRKRYRMGDPLLPFVEGNMGALRVLTDLSQKIQGMDFMMFVLDLDDMNIRGAQIWVAYKDVCRNDLEALIKRVKGRDPTLADAINDVIPEGERAVPHGGSFAHL